MRTTQPHGITQLSTKTRYFLHSIAYLGYRGYPNKALGGGWRGACNIEGMTTATFLLLLAAQFSANPTTMRVATWQASSLVDFGCPVAAVLERGDEYVAVCSADTDPEATMLTFESDDELDATPRREAHGTH